MIASKNQNMIGLITGKEIESVFKYLPTNKIPGLHVFTCEFHQTLKDLITTLLKIFQKIEEKGTLLKFIFMRPELP